MPSISSRLASALRAVTPAASSRDIASDLQLILSTDAFRDLVTALVDIPAFSVELGTDFAAADAVTGITPARMLRGALNLPLGQVFVLLAQLSDALIGTAETAALSRLADRVLASDLAQTKLIAYLTMVIEDDAGTGFYATMADHLVETDPHAIYPTSPYRVCDGRVESTPDHQHVEAVVSFSTFATIRTIDRVLDVDEPTLHDLYLPLGRCVCLVDQNVEELHGAELDRYFRHHGISLEKRVYRAMEADKGLATVERMLGDFKKLGVSRNEPVLIVGGGVLSDTGGLACALYGRNTPYVMLSTSIVTGIDAGPSPRTCCDGFGYKNLLGAYHPPILSITDRFFFGTLREGWLRHGMAEIIKMAVVKNAELFADLEEAQDQLIATRFGTIDCAASDPIQPLSQKIIGGALRSYIEAEYDNLYETHQCRPHAYGHTWSPGFEIEAGLLHGHAVSIGMGLGAYLSRERGWITAVECDRILKLMSGYGLSLWHDILRDERVMVESHRKIIQKRGGNLVAPLPRGAIGQCGYLNNLSERDLLVAINGYAAVCEGYLRGGRGIDPLCSDVGLEDPSTVMEPLLQH